MGLIGQVASRKKYHWLTVILFTISLFLLQACNDDKAERVASLQSYNIQAETYLEQSQFKAAIAASKQAIKVYPESINAYLLLAQVYSQLGLPELTIKVLNSYDNKRTSEYYFLLLGAYQDNNQLAKASELVIAQAHFFEQQKQRFILEKAKLNLLSNNTAEASVLFKSLEGGSVFSTQALIGKARLMMAADDRESAILLLDGIIVNAPENSESRLLKSTLLMQKRDFIGAEELLTEAVSVMPSSDLFTSQKVKALGLLSEVLTAQGRSSESLFYARILAKEHPEKFLISQYYQKALTDYREKKFTLAKVSLDRLLAIAPSNQDVLTLYAAVLYQQGEVAKGSRYVTNVEGSRSTFTMLEEIRVSNPNKITQLLSADISSENNPDILALYLLASVQSKQFTESEKAHAQIEKISANSVQSLLSEAYYYAHKLIPEHDKSLSLLKEGLKAFPQSKRIKLHYLVSLDGLQKEGEALQYVQSLEDSSSGNVNTLLLLGQYQLYRQEYLRADFYFEQLLRASPDNINALIGLADSAYSKAKFNQALKIYKRVIELEPQVFIAYQGCVDSLSQLAKSPERLQELLPKNHQPALLALALVSLQVQQYKLQTADKHLQVALKGAPAYLQSYAQKLDREKTLQQASQAAASYDFSRARKLILDNLKKIRRF